MNSKKFAVLLLAVAVIGIYLFYSEESVSEPPIQSEKVYTVSEILKIRDTNPESLIDKSILLKAYVVDAVAGIGCEDFYILTDYENVNFYREYTKHYNGTEEEKIKFNNIPRLEASVRTVINGSISESIVIGHFYDDWEVKNCDNGWMRFEITGKKETLKKEKTNELKFDITYPQNWSVQKNHTDEQKVPDDSSCGVETHLVRGDLASYNNCNFETYQIDKKTYECILKYAENKSTNVCGTETISINNLQGKEIRCNSKWDSRDYNGYYFQNNDIVLRIFLDGGEYSLEPGQPIPSDFIDCKNGFNQILSTIELVQNN